MSDAEKSGGDFTDLRVWQRAMDLGERIYRLTWTFPRSETYGLSGQLQRAVLAVPSNIAEGRTRNSLKDYLRFVSIARGSLAEVQTQILFAVRVEYLTRQQSEPLLAEIRDLTRQLNALRNALEAKLSKEHVVPETRNPKPETRQGSTR